MTDISQVIQELREVFGARAANSVITDEVTLAELGVDTSGVRRGAAVALVRPAQTSDVQGVVKVADRHHVAIVAQGSRSSLAGAASATEGAILVDFSRMRQIIAIDPTERLAVVQPGVRVEELAAAVEREGLFYAPDPVSSHIASIGGTVATNAGGMRCIKYGVTRDSVRSLEVVLADGSVIQTRRNTMKSVAGLDITSLMVGSEGTLGLVTEVTVSLRSKPGPSRGVAAMFASMSEALAAANAIATAPLPPAVLELLDDVALDAIRAYDSNIHVPDTARAWLLAVTDASVAAEAELDSFELAYTKHGAISVTRAEDSVELDNLFATRRALHPALTAYLSGALHGDIAVPRSALGEFVERSEKIAEQHGVTISIGGHVADGNLHPVVAFDVADAEQAIRAHEAQNALLKLAQDLGGTISGEHGIGVEKRAALDGELEPRVRELQLAIKAAFDPKGILNPGAKL